MLLVLSYSFNYVRSPIKWKVVVDTFLSTADDPCWANLKLPFLEITVVPEADSNKNWPTDDVWKNSYSAPIGQVLSKTIEAVNVP